MPNVFIKPEVVLAQMLGVLDRDTVLAQFVWRDAATAASFKNSKNDTVTLKLPAYTTARTRVMRSGTAIVVDNLDETSVDITLDTHVYKAIGISDEELTLDITDFGAQITAPAMGAVVRKVDDTIATTMSAADYEVTIDIDPSDPYPAIVGARKALNLANVPADGRFLAVGADIEEDLLLSDRLAKFDLSGSSEAFREAVIGRIAGFTAVTAIGLDPGVMIAAHKTAFPLQSIVPLVPGGCTWGETRTWKGFGLRTLRDYDPTGSGGPQDRLLADVFIGTGVTKDRGTIDGDGKFQPSVDGDDDPILVRAVLMTVGS